MKIKLKKLNSSGFSHHLILPVLVIAAVAAIGIYLLKGSRAAELPKSNQQNIAANNASDQDLAASPQNQTIFYYQDSDINGCSPTNGGKNCGPSVITHLDDHNTSIPRLVTLDFSPCKTDIGCMTWDFRGAATDLGYAWDGPGRDMQVPAGMKGIRGCFRYAHTITPTHRDEIPKTTNVTVELTSELNGQETVIASTVNKDLKPIEQLGPTVRTCAKANTTSGPLAAYKGTFPKVGVRLKIDIKLINYYHFIIGRSALGYY